MSTPEELFARYAETGDVDALSDVFHALGPRLLRLASHLAPDEGIAGAEGLLQATFLIAIKKARMFDARRALEPWLAGMLVREAQKLARQKRRRLSAPVDAPAPHPLEEAQRHELVASL